MDLRSKDPAPPKKPDPRVQENAEPTLLVETLPKSLVCALHGGLLRDPLVSKCGHTFCESCIRQSMAAGKMDCPLDGEPINISGKCIPIVEMISELEIYCKYGIMEDRDGELVVNPKGCTKTIKLGSRRAHEDYCLFAPMECPYCGLSLPRKKEVKTHIASCRRVTCPQATFGCTYRGTLSDVENHLTTCEYEDLARYIPPQTHQDKIERLEQENVALREELQEIHGVLAELKGRLDNMELSRNQKPMAESEEIDAADVLPAEEQQRRPRNAKKKPKKPKRPKKRPSKKKHPVPEQDVSSFKFSELGTLDGHKGIVWTVTATKNHIISGCADSTIKVWDSNTLVNIRTLPGHAADVHAFAIYDKWLISGSEDRTIRIWNTTTWECKRVIAGHQQPICALLIDPKRKILFSGSFGEIRVWDLNTFTQTNTLKHKHYVRGMVISKDGNSLYAGCFNQIKVWDLNTFTCVHTLSDRYGSIECLAVYGHYLLAGIFEKTIKVFDLENAYRVTDLQGHLEPVLSIKVHGKLLFSGSSDTTVKVWNLDSKDPSKIRCIQNIKRHTSSVEEIAWIGDNRFASASSDTTVKIFQLETDE